MIRKSLLLGAAIVAGLGVGIAQAQQRNSLTIGVVQFPSSFHPNIDPLTVKTYALGLTKRPLTLYDPTPQKIAQLAVDVPTIENGGAKIVDLGGGKRGIEVTIRLQPNARWGDGRPVTSRDLLFGIKMGKTEGTSVNNTEVFRRIAKAEARGDKTVVITIDGTPYDYNDLYDIHVLPAHIEEPILDGLAAKTDYKANTAYNRATNTPGLWAGPYMISEVQTGSQIIFTRNPHWWGKRPAFDRVVMRAVENTAALQANLLSGDIDMPAGEGVGLSIDQVLALRKDNNFNARFNVNIKPALTHEHIDLNQDNPILKDKRVRQGLLFAIDREQLVKELFEGTQPVATGWIAPASPEYTNDVKQYRRDTRQAIQLFEQAGFNRTGSDGIRVNAQGQRLSFEFMTTAGNRLREQIQQYLQSQWKEVGVEVVIKNEPARTYFGETLRQRRYTGMGLYAWTSQPEESPERILGTKGIPTQANGWAGSNYPGWSNAEFDRLNAQLMTELDFNKRKPIWAQMQKIYAEELPALPLFYRADPHVWPKWLGNVRPTGNQFSVTYWIEDWTVSSN